MMLDDISAEKRRARAIASDYRIRGYSVLEEPSPEQLPDFLSGYSPTMVAYKDGESAESMGETVVVVVKARLRPGKERRVGELAELIRNTPGWKFELALAESEAELDTPDAAIPFGREEIHQCNKTARQLLKSGFQDSALLQAWKGVEAAVRLLLKEERLEAGEAVAIERGTINRLLGSSVYYGVISQEDYSILADAMRYRNAYVHGFTLPEFDPAQAVNTIISTTERLLECAPPESD